MIQHVKKKLSKRELYERDGFTKHGRTKPYKRHRVVADNFDDAQEFLRHALEDSEPEDRWLDSIPND